MYFTHFPALSKTLKLLASFEDCQHDRTAKQFNDLVKSTGTKPLPVHETVEISPHLIYLCLNVLADTIRLKCPYTEKHSQRVRQISLQIADHMNLSLTEKNDLGHAAVLHDLGKLVIPQSILTKPTLLNREEWAMIYRHPIISESIASQFSFLSGTLPAIRHHHERYDGCGYPDGLKGEDIPLPARIIAVADAYDAMTNTRPYRKAMPQIKALTILQEEGYKQFDPHITHAFVYSQSRLSTGQCYVAEK